MHGTVDRTAGDLRPGPIVRMERSEAAFVHAERHSRRVRVLKLVLPLAALLMVAAFVGYSMLASTVQRVTGLGNLSFKDGGVVMANPKLEGFTKDDLPYSLRAERATQPLGEAGSIELEGLTASVPIDKDNRASIVASSGIFNREKNILDIDSEITLNATSGLVAKLQSATIDIADSTLTTDKPVDISLNGMHIAADGMQVADGGKTLTFTQRVRVEIDPARLKLEAAENQPDE